MLLLHFCNVIIVTIIIMIIMTIDTINTIIIYQAKVILSSPPEKINGAE